MKKIIVVDDSAVLRTTMQNALNSEVSEVFETYTFKVGLREGRFAFSTAVGLFQSFVGFTLIMITNKAARRFGEGGLW